MDSNSIMEKLLANPGHCQIVRHISSFLDLKSLTQCRLVSQSWRDLIDNDRPWLVFQLEHIYNTSMEMLICSARYDGVDLNFLKAVTSRPEWYTVIQQISSIPRLKKVVQQLWVYLPNHEFRDPLNCAIMKSNSEFVELLIDSGIDLTRTALDGWSPMHYACSSGNKEIVQMFIKHLPTFDTSSRTEKGATIFHVAAMNPDPQVPQLILDKFKYEDFRDENGYSMIHYAIRDGS